jgi:hypothetical protein
MCCRQSGRPCMSPYLDEGGDGFTRTLEMSNICVKRTAGIDVKRPLGIAGSISRSAGSGHSRARSRLQRLERRPESVLIPERQNGSNFRYFGTCWTRPSLEVFRGTPKRALLEAYLNPTQFEYSKAVRGVLARYFSRYSSSLL